jgi:three-Cys-motif partner protein
MQSLDLFLNFPILDVNRNALWRDGVRTSPVHVERMTRFWGDDSWRSILYKESAQRGLFGVAVEKAGNDEVARAFRDRLRQVAGFRFVPNPMPMRNSKGAIVYYLFFASQKDVANRVVTHIFDKHSMRSS